jgi:hypothetical protein
LPSTIAKISLCGSNYMDVLLEEMSIENIPELLGGRCKAYNEPYTFDLSEDGPLYYLGSSSPANASLASQSYSFGSPAGKNGRSASAAAVVVVPTTPFSPLSQDSFFNESPPSSISSSAGSSRMRDQKKKSALKKAQSWLSAKDASGLRIENFMHHEVRHKLTSPQMRQQSQPQSQHELHAANHHHKQHYHNHNHNTTHHHHNGKESTLSTVEEITTTTTSATTTGSAASPAPHRSAPQLTIKTSNLSALDALTPPPSTNSTASNVGGKNNGSLSPSSASAIQCAFQTSAEATQECSVFDVFRALIAEFHLFLSSLFVVLTKHPLKTIVTLALIGAFMYLRSIECMHLLVFPVMVIVSLQYFDLLK